MAHPVRTITVALDMSKAFDTINIYIYIYTNQKAATDQPSLAPSYSSLQTTSRDAKPTQYTQTTHPYSVNLELAFPKVTSFHPQYLTFTLQTYHHLEHRFRSFHTQITSHPHTQAGVQPSNTYNHTYIQFMHGQNMTISH